MTTATKKVESKDPESKIETAQTPELDEKALENVSGGVVSGGGGDSGSEGDGGQMGSKSSNAKQR